MIERAGDIFSPDGYDHRPHVAPPWVVIPTNGETKAGGKAVMGAGVAKAAAYRWPEAQDRLGADLRVFGARTVLIGTFSVGDSQNPDHARVVVAFPTKDSWRGHSTLALIERSARELVDLVNREERKPFEVRLPRVGTGLGGLSWTAVRPILERHLPDDLFVVLYPPGARA